MDKLGATRPLRARLCGAAVGTMGGLGLGLKHEACDTLLVPHAW